MFMISEINNQKLYDRYSDSRVCITKGIPSQLILSRSISLKMSDLNEIKSELKLKLNSDMKESMKNKQKERLSAIRSILTAIKQKEVDERVVVDDEMAIAIMSKLVKQRKESIKSYADAGRQDLVESEQAELDTINSYLPKPLSLEEVEAIIDSFIVSTEAKTIKDMGKVMNAIKPLLTGKADISDVGAIIKKKLST